MEAGGHEYMNIFRPCTEGGTLVLLKNLEVHQLQGYLRNGLAN